MAAKRVAQEKIHDRRSSDLTLNSQVAIAIVDDPYSDKGEKIQVIRSLRDDPLAWMKDHTKIDDAQFIAGRHWQRLHQASTIGVIRAIDPAKEAVDGGQMPEALTDKQIDAFRQLAESYKALGAYGGRLIFYILGEGRNIKEAGTLMGCASKYELEYIGRRFRECLETLAIHWGYAQPKYPRR